jgi:N-glycosylase/DNA lyase
MARKDSVARLRWIVRSLQKDDAVRSIITKRIDEFRSFQNKHNRSWFSELCFCLLTANWKAKESIAIQQELGPKGFLTMPQDRLQQFLKSRGHRFHPQRAERIVLARDFADIKTQLKGLSSQNARLFLVDHIKGYGYKEASHFLRNVGYLDVAIIDRHILRLLKEHELFCTTQKTMTTRCYLEAEDTFNRLAETLDLSAGELDLYLWYHATGTVLK